MAHSAPKTNRHIGIALRVIDKRVGNVVGMIVETCHGLTVHTFGQRQLEQCGQDRGRTDANVQRIHFSAGVQARFEAHQAGGTVQAVLNFFFAAPQHFDGLARHGFGNHDRLTRKVLRALATQTTAQLHGVNFDVGWWHTCCGSTDCQGGFWVLCGRPHIQFVALQPSRTHHGLHGGVRQVRCEIFGFNHLGRFSKGLECIAIVSCDGQFGLRHACFEVRHDGGAAECAVLTHLPFNRHFTQGFFGTPPVVCNHGHKTSEVQDLDNAAAIFNLGGVQ